MKNTKENVQNEKATSWLLFFLFEIAKDMSDENYELLYICIRKFLFVDLKLFVVSNETYRKNQ